MATTIDDRIHFICPTPGCGAEHWRGFLDGVSVFRCLRCGYQGHGFHHDHDIDREVFAQHQEANAYNRLVGVPEVTLGDDPLSHGC